MLLLIDTGAEVLTVDCDTGLVISEKDKQPEGWRMLCAVPKRTGNVFSHRKHYLETAADLIRKMEPISLKDLCSIVQSNKFFYNSDKRRPLWKLVEQRGEDIRLLSLAFTTLSVKENEHGKEN